MDHDLKTELRTVLSYFVATITVLIAICLSFALLAEWISPSNDRHVPWRTQAPRCER